MNGLAIVILVLFSTSDPLAAVQESHIAANVPPPEAFDRILRRDLAAYLRSRDEKAVSITYELLRDGPTQSGVAYPKFYVWVRALDNRKKVIEEGAARVAAIEMKRFEVTDFLSAHSIQQAPESIRRVFPAPVCERILQRVGAK